MLDEALKQAINQVVAESNQSKRVARRLIAWLNEMSTAELSNDEHTQFLRYVREALSLGSNDED